MDFKEFPTYATTVPGESKLPGTADTTAVGFQQETHEFTVLPPSPPPDGPQSGSSDIEFARFSGNNAQDARLPLPAHDGGAQEHTKQWDV